MQSRTGSSRTRARSPLSRERPACSSRLGCGESVRVTQHDAQLRRTTATMESCVLRVPSARPSPTNELFDLVRPNRGSSKSLRILGATRAFQLLAPREGAA